MSKIPSLLLAMKSNHERVVREIKDQIEEEKENRAETEAILELMKKNGIHCYSIEQLLFNKLERIDKKIKEYEEISEYRAERAKMIEKEFEER